MKLPMDLIRRLVGDITEDPFGFIDFAVTETVGLFVPLTGQCYYAVTPEHTHPSYSFVVSFDDFCQLKIDDRILEIERMQFPPVDLDVAMPQVMVDHLQAARVGVQFGIRGCHSIAGAF